MFVPKQDYAGLQCSGFASPIPLHALRHRGSPSLASRPRLVNTSPTALLDSRTAKAAANLLAPAIIAAGCLLSPSPSGAYTSGEPRVIGEIDTAGIFFKDILRVVEFEDPKISGVRIYISEFDKPLIDRVKAGKWFQQPSSASVTCAKVGPTSVRPDINKSKQGEEIFTDSRTLSFSKAIDVRRIYDEESKTAVYISYGSRFIKEDDDHHTRFRASLCAVPLD
eukprot:Plantae.Rhodophyta-Rhodochaete_pulchella.ctg3016.p1 GENE.Plantae.Rhodophyta-Rhodochaete_pulchella.ctg3016~~Plantae.Rhodophyta-Rhodochaete_pulchella.ctg3016.p1  ORF type:complete len:223 (+),score=23.57 Plantae.Rhodophyta-Rhodochaete_pulchella.ctg3016:1220-1888(+)